MPKSMRRLAILFLLVAFPSAAQYPKPKLLEPAKAGSPLEVLKMMRGRVGPSVMDKDGWVPPLIRAVHLNRSEIVKGLLERGADPNVGRKDRATPLMIAAAAADQTIVRHLLEKGANVNAKDQDGWTPLLSAAFAGPTNIVRSLLNKGADISVVDRIGQTALMTAAVRGQTDAVRVLVESGAEVNATDKDGRTALIHAADLGHTDTVRALLKRGADVALRHASGATALRLAQKGHFPEIVALLNGAPQAMPSSRSLNKVVDAPVAPLALAKYRSTDLRGQFVVAADNLERPNKKRPDEHIPLIAASVTHDTYTVPALLKGEANANAKRQSGGTAELAQDQQPAGQAGTAVLTEFAQIPAGQVVVTYLNGALTVKANNAPLSRVLRAVCDQTGTELDLTSGADEQIFADIGPGPAKKVIASLLEGTPYNFVMVQSADDPYLVATLVVLPRTNDSSTREQAPQSQVAQNRVAPNPPPSQPEAASPHGGPTVKEMGTQPQIKELLAQVKAELANSADLDPETMRVLDEQMKAAEAAAADPSAIDQQASGGAGAGASPGPNGPAAGRPRHRRR